MNSGCRWPNIGKAFAASIRGGQLEGPGPIKVLKGKFMGRSKDSGGGASVAIAAADLINAWLFAEILSKLCASISLRLVDKMRCAISPTGTVCAERFQHGEDWKCFLWNSVYMFSLCFNVNICEKIETACYFWRWSHNRVHVSMNSVAPTPNTPHPFITGGWQHEQRQASHVMNHSFPIVISILPWLNTTLTLWC